MKLDPMFVRSQTDLTGWGTTYPKGAKIWVNKNLGGSCGYTGPYEVEVLTHHFLSAQAQMLSVLVETNLVDYFDALKPSDILGRTKEEAEKNVQRLKQRQSEHVKARKESIKKIADAFLSKS